MGDGARPEVICCWHIGFGVCVKEGVFAGSVFAVVCVESVRRIHHDTCLLRLKMCLAFTLYNVSVVLTLGLSCA